MQWQEINNQLTKTFKFSNFVEALKFTNQVGDIAEKLGHHPIITLTWGKVVISITTHDAGNIVTDKDWKLVNAIDKLDEFTN